MSEADASDFEVAVTGRYKNADGEYVDIEGLTNGGNVTIQGDTEITFTNKRKVKKIKIYKVDDSDPEVPLEGVIFTIDGKTPTTGVDGYTEEVLLNASPEAYQLSETPLPHYTGLSEAVPVNVTAEGVTINPAQADRDKVSLSGPDDDGVYTIKIVNPRERYTVTVKKNVVGNTASDGPYDKAIPFSFSASGLTAEVDIFNLKHEETKVYQDIPYGTTFTVEESQNTAFDTSIDISKADGSKTTVDDRATGTQTVDGNMTVEYTNTRNKQTVIIHKEDANDHSSLSGAQFNINSNDYTTGEGGNTETIDLPVSNTAYVLKETVAPDGYVLPENDSSITVSAGKVEYQQGTSGQRKDATFDPERGIYTVTITNTAGKPLPHTGGIGTAIFYILGGMLTFGCGVVIVSRRRIGTNK